jgi:hypothetical protein
MQEAKMTILNQVHFLWHLTSNLRFERDKLKAESLASNEKANATVCKLRAKNYTLHIKCGKLYDERVPLSALWARGPNVGRVAQDCSRGSSGATSPGKGAWRIEARLGRALPIAVQSPSLGGREV